MSGLLGRFSAFLFAPVRRLLGPLHRRRPSFTDEERNREDKLPPLPPPWNHDSRWYPEDFPPRARNQLQPLPHGAQYFSDLCQELRNARERVTIAGWALTPLMAIEREPGSPTVTFTDLMREVSERAEVYVLLWAGAPALFQPNTHSVERSRERLLESAPRVRCELDRTAAFSHDHHQKAVTIDGRVAYVGGMDISTFQGDRWDTAKHPLRFGVGWHDVQVRLEGEVVQDVEENFCQRWNAAVGGTLRPLEPVVETAWDTPAQVVRTIPRGFYPSFAPEGHFGIRHALLRGIGNARQSIYLENQYLWAPEIVEALCTAMDRNDSKTFRIIVVLPARAYDGRYDNDDHVRDLYKHDNGRGIFSAYSIYSSGPGEGMTGHRYVPIYVHAKVAIVDDSWFLVGSANLNRRGLSTDSEIAVQSIEPDTAASLRLSLWAEHLGLDEKDLSRNFAQVADEDWKRRASELERAVKRGDPPPGGQVHPYSYGGTPQSRLLDRFQALTLEH